MIRDQWMRESLRDMGNQDAGAGFLAHLFVNGLYWGLHNVAERQDNAHYANYDGGDSDLIDARNGGTFVEGNSNSLGVLVVTPISMDPAHLSTSLSRFTCIQRPFDVEGCLLRLTEPFRHNP